MSDQSTIIISRNQAISRILRINELAEEDDYRSIVLGSFEVDDPQDFVLNWVSVQEEDLQKYTNEMLADLMDMPFVRFTMFDNYTVS